VGIILGLVGFVVAMFLIATIWGVVDGGRDYRAELKDPEKVNQMGVESAKRGDYGPAVLRFRHALQMGHTGAACNLGLLFAQGKGVPKNTTEAFKAFNYAAERGLAEGQFHVALSCFNGSGTEKQFAKAFHYFKAAADQGYKPAREFVQAFEDSAAGYDPHEPEASSDDVREQRMAVISHCRRRNTIAGYEEAANEYADLDSAIALSICYLNGKLVEVDRAKAFEWIKHARDMGSRKARVIFDRIHPDVEVDLDAIVADLMLCESAQDDDVARYELGSKFLHGKSVDVNLQEASYYFLMSRTLPESRAALASIPQDEWPEEFQGLDLTCSS
jgi:TPR repeat protein